MLHSVISSEFNLFNGYVILLKCTHTCIPASHTYKLVYTLVLDHKLSDVLRVMHCSFECVLGAIQLSNGFEDCS